MGFEMIFELQDSIFVVFRQFVDLVNDTVDFLFSLVLEACFGRVDGLLMSNFIEHHLEHGGMLDDWIVIVVKSVDVLSYHCVDSFSLIYCQGMGLRVLLCCKYVEACDLVERQVQKVENHFFWLSVRESLEYGIKVFVFDIRDCLQQNLSLLWSPFCF